MNQLTRRQAAGAALGLLSAGAVSAAPNLRPLTEAEGNFIDTYTGIYTMTGLLVNDIFTKAEPACPGLRAYCEQRFAELWHDVTTRYPNLARPMAPLIRRYIDTYTGEEARQRDQGYAVSKEAHSKSEHEKSLRFTEREKELRAEFEAYNPTSEEIEEHVTNMRGRRQSQLAMDLSIARKLWRAHPELVECENFPEPYLSAYLEYEDGDVEEINIDVDVLSGDFEQRIAAEAPAILRGHREDEFTRSLKALAKELGPEEWHSMMAE